MEVISIDGIEYVKASQVAKRFRYTNDYVGQLCRGGKVDAKLVGRTWYVNPLSIEGHKTTRYLKTNSNEKSLPEKAFSQPKTKIVEPVLRKETLKHTPDASLGGASFLKRVVWQPVKYEHDTSELLPPLKPASEPVSVPVSIAESERLPIRNLSSITKMETEPLPEFLLQGGVKVKSIDDNFDNSEENIAIPADLRAEVAAHLVVDEVGKSNYKVKIQKPRQEVAKTNDSLDETDKYSYPVPITVEESSVKTVTHHTSFVPDRVRHKTEIENFDSGQKKISRRMTLTAFTLGLLILTSVFCLVTLEKVITVDQVGYVSALEFNFSTSNLSQFFSKN